jgi:hypothetical protein
MHLSFACSRPAGRYGMETTARRVARLAFRRGASISQGTNHAWTCTANPTMATDMGSKPRRMLNPALGWTPIKSHLSWPLVVANLACLTYWTATRKSKHSACRLTDPPLDYIDIAFSDDVWFYMTVFHACVSIEAIYLNLGSFAPALRMSPDIPISPLAFYLDVLWIFIAILTGSKRLWDAPHLSLHGEKAEPSSNAERWGFFCIFFSYLAINAGRFHYRPFRRTCRGWNYLWYRLVFEFALYLCVSVIRLSLSLIPLSSLSGLLTVQVLRGLTRSKLMGQAGHRDD